MSILVAAAILCATAAVDPQALIDDVRKKANLPAVGLAMVKLSGEPKIWVTGVRRLGQRDLVEVGDTWHLGSDTKAFTAALVAALIDSGKGSYQQRIADLLGVKNPDSTHRGITVADVLDMRGNLDHDPQTSWFMYQAMAGTLDKKRQMVADNVLATPPKEPQEKPFHYSNVGYVLLGHLAEVWTYEPYETAVRQHLLTPLGIRSVGFGPNPAGQPWPHIDGKRITTGVLDNPPIMAPAGAMRLSLRDWAVWTQQVMKSVRGDPSLLAKSYGKRMRDSAGNGAYVNGWIKLTRGWSAGPVYSHSGSNTMNYCTAWLAPAEGVAYLMVTNGGGKTAQPALDTIVAQMITSGAKDRY